MKNMSFRTFFILILAVLGILYGPNLFKGGVPINKSISLPVLALKHDYLLVKKIAEFPINPAPGKTFYATDVAAIGPNLMAVADSPGNQILIYDFKGNLIRKWGKMGTGPKDLHEPSGLATDHKGTLYVMDTWNGAVKVFDQYGKLKKVLDLARFGFFYGPRRVGWGGGSLLVPNPSNNRLARLSLGGELLNVWEDKDNVGQLSSAVGDGKGHFYVAGTANNKNHILELDESGKVTQTLSSGNSASELVLGPKGRLFAGGYGIASRVFDSNGSLLGELADEAAPEKPLDTVYGIDVAEDGTILTCLGETAALYRFSKDKEK